MAAKNLKVHFSSKTDMWSTPQYVFDDLNAKYGPFHLDVCASPSNAKRRWWLGELSDGRFIDGLKVQWHNPDPDIRCWMNPVYSELGKWLKKAYEESQKGCTVVCLIPSRTDTKAWHQYVMKAAEVLLIEGRLKFGDATNSAPFPSCVVVFRPGNHTPVFSSYKPVGKK